MIKRTTYVIVVASALAGCSAFARFTATLPMPLSAIRSPITIKNFFWEHNGPIDAADRGLLNCAALLVVGDHNKSRDVAWNESRSNVFCNGSLSVHTNDFDTFQDLCKPDLEGPYSGTLLLVALSGGGARATALASHALAILEDKYNAYYADLLIQAIPFGPIRDFIPFIDRIAALSTVSGGSIYAHYVAQVKTLLDDMQLTLDSKRAERQDEFNGNFTKAIEVLKGFFQILDSSDMSSAEMVALLTGVNYFGGSLILPLITDVNYMHLSQGLSQEAAISHYLFTKWLADVTEDTLATPLAINTIWEVFRRTYMPTEIKLSHLTPKPRFFFDATIMETGLPLVFTQRFTNLPIENMYGQTARLDLRMQNRNYDDDRTLKKLRPLDATTLEDINSSPTTVPVALAAMASAAFPIGIEPLELKKYGYHPSYKSIRPSEDILRITDVGVYDNSGLTTLIELMEYLSNADCEIKRIIILAINADAESHDVYFPHKDPTSEPLWRRLLPISIGWPIRWRTLGTEALSRIHFTNKRRAEQMAIRKMEEIRERRDKKGKRKVEFLYFPISLAQLSAADENRLPDPSNLYQRLQEIPTDYHISEEESTLLAQAAGHIINVEQREGWEFDGEGKNRNRRLGKALVKALR
jgi:hypothetical protein